MDVFQLDRKVAGAFSNVNKDVVSLKKEILSLNKAITLSKQECTEKYISREDYVKLFSEFANLKQEVTDELKKIKETTDNFAEESEKRNNRLTTLVEDEKANKAEIKEVKKTREELKKLQESFLEFKENMHKAVDSRLNKLDNALNTNISNSVSRKEFDNEFDKLVLNFEQELERINEKVTQLTEFSMDADDVEKQFITRKDVISQIKQIKENSSTKKEVLGLHEELHKKVNHLNTELDEVNSALITIKSSLKEGVKSKAFDELKHEIKNNLVEKNDLIQAVVDIQKNIVEVGSSVEKLEKEIKEKEEKGLNANELAKLKEDIGKIKDNLILKREVERFLETSTKKHQSLKEDVDEIETKINRTITLIDAMADKTKNVDFSNFAKRKELEEIEGKLTRINNFVSSNSIKTKDIQKINKQLDDIKENVALKLSRKDVDKEFKVLTTKISDLKEDLEKIEEKVK
ncbi:hypothetical protein HY636_06285 [Candidatus Woesearchaeota archaeon]|nr:hypothetical protein [Candidatus Woesearchaeota archaeon]